MNLLFSIVYSAHAKGTHHKLAMDALRHLKTDDKERWQRLFLKHAELYLEGSKAPDNEFKDFMNHVLHVRDNYWGGACGKAESWYGHLITALKEKNWSEAVWAAGVLSHYYSDPIHPFHTAQSEAENNIHRAAEWSISKSYNSLKKLGEATHSDLTVPAPASKTWLREMVCAGAEKSNAQYERLIAHYDINQGVIDPPSGLDTISRELIAELLIYASRGFATILDRAIAEAGVTPPDVDLTAETLLSGLKTPVKWVLKRIDDAQERAQIEAMYDELKSTGRVEKNLPEDDRMVRNRYQKEIEAPRQLHQVKERAALIASTPSTSAPRQQTKTRTPPPAATKAGQSPAKPAAQTPKKTPRGARTYLKLTDNVERGPSVGPKLAEYLAAVDVITVQDLLNADAADIATRLDHRAITTETVQNWQDQARLMIDVPGIRGGQSQLLVGAGYRTREKLASAKLDTVCADVLAFASTQEGQRFLRDGAPPDPDQIGDWLDAAKNQNAEAA